MYIITSYLAFKIFKKNLKKTNQALINIYSFDNGIFNKKLHKKISHKKKITKKTGLNYEAVKDLKENGYHIFKRKIDENIVNKLYDLALNLKCDDVNKKSRFNPNKITRVRYNFNKQDLANNLLVQDLIMDDSLISIVREYFNSEPIFDLPAMWWSAPYGESASSEAAQLYHYDMERAKWLKIFFYLTDVDSDNGPHYYIRGSHKINAKPKNLLSRGYVRISDQEIKKYYSPNDFKVIKGTKGTFFAGDTLCWHKGKNLKKRNRLVLELNYTSSLFGYDSEKFHIENYTEKFRSFCNKNPIYSKNISFEN
jgi:hypothetical protein